MEFIMIGGGALGGLIVGFLLFRKEPEVIVAQTLQCVLEEITSPEFQMRIIERWRRLKK